MGGAGTEDRPVDRQPDRPVRPGGDARALLVRAEALHAAARAVLTDHAQVRTAIRQALAPLREALVRTELDGIPLSRLRDVTGGRLRLGALEQAGYTTVGQVLAAGPYALRQVPGIGGQSAHQAVAAAGQIAESVKEHTAVRLDIDASDDDAATATATAAAAGTADTGTRALVAALSRLVQAGPDIPRAVRAAERVDGELGPLLAAARPARGRLRMLVTRSAARQQAQHALQQIDALLADCAAQQVPLLLAQADTDLLRPAAPTAEAWLDFQVRPAEYTVLLAEFAGLDDDADTAEGFLPEGIADRVRAQPLDDTHRRVSLRGYQSFGARFALAQRRAMLGDEMGLGKTVQAIAALAHLKTAGRTHFLVVCPASVMINWIREIESRSTLRAYRVHGPGRDAALAEWTGRGDIAVTTFDVLGSLSVPDTVALGMLVVDEAHYVKNPDTRRSHAVGRWADRTDHVLFLTGTPMENRVEEFRSLVRHLQPDLLPGIRHSDAAAGSTTFRRAVAPAYLRRNQQDVLPELPELRQIDEWEEFSPADHAAYREACAAGNFMAMRRAAYADPAHSAKLRRLRELVDEAAGNDRKVVVFSFFGDVLTAAQAALGTRAFGPVSGRVSAAGRQELVDRFTAEEGHAVLLSQIQAGGTGLNIQAASVVVLCEPQVKPTLEAQAIGRAHRMGQLRHVQVHRLLTTDSVDQRMLDILGTKQRLFDAYARRSDVAESTPDAVDISEQSLARQIVAEEQQRLAVTPSDDPHPSPGAFTQMRTTPKT